MEKTVTKTKEEIETTEIPEPIGNNILNHKTNHGVLHTNQGSFYHYADICQMLRVFADQEVKKAKVELLEELIHYSIDSKYTVSFSEKADGYNDAIENITKRVHEKIKALEKTP